MSRWPLDPDRMPLPMSRRAWLRAGLSRMGVLLVGPTLYACGRSEVIPQWRLASDRRADEDDGPIRITRRDRPRALGEAAPRDAGTSVAEPDAAALDAGGSDLADRSEPEIFDAGYSATRGSTGVEPRAIVRPPLRIGPLSEPDELGLRLLPGCRARIVARSGQPPVVGCDYLWHAAPDGGAVFAMDDGGWIYVSNGETTPGGVGALRFSADGQAIDAYSLVTGTRRNCAGGATPWGTWLTCEEIEYGYVFECDPLGLRPAELCPALGAFRHEAVAVDPETRQLYLTEDQPSGLLYRFTPASKDASGRPDLSAGRLEAAAVRGGAEGVVEWLPVTDPQALIGPVRYGVAGATPFDGGEGIWHERGVIYFATKGDNRVWALDLASQTLVIAYDYRTAQQPVLSGVDNVAASAGGHILVAEDGGDMQIVALGQGASLAPIVQVVGQDGSEITGPAFDPSGTRLYFSSQRGVAGVNDDGITYEVTGPFFG